MKKIILFFFLFLQLSLLCQQLNYYEDSFKGGVTGAGYSPAYNSIGDTGYFSIHIAPGSTIRKAFLISGKQGPASPLTVNLNGNYLTFDTLLSKATPAFFSLYYGGASAVHSIDVTSNINPTVSNYKLYVPLQNSTSNRFTDFYLYVAYDNPALPQINTAIFLNTHQLDSLIDYTFSFSNPIKNTSDVGMAIMGGYMCSSPGDGCDIYCNGTSLGNIGGNDINSGICGGPIGSFYYDNGTLTELSDDNSDQKVGGTDALSNIKAVIGNGTNTIPVKCSNKPDNQSNALWAFFFTYGASCTPATLSSTINNHVTCYGKTDGTSTITPSGGVSPFNYSWVSSAGNINQNTSTATGLSAGNYTVTVNDSSGCAGNITITITQPTQINVSSSTRPTTCTSNSGSISITVTGGNSPYTYSWNNTSSNQNISNLSEGIYTVTIKDINSCSMTKTALISNPGNTITFSTNKTDETCGGKKDGKATINTLTGGTTPYTYSWSNSQTTSSLTGITAGTYTIKVTDINGCTFTQSVQLTQGPNPVANASPDTTSIFQGTPVQLSATGGQNYSWTPANNLTCITCATPIATPTESSWYYLTVIDAVGCTGIDSVYIQVELPCGNLFVPTAFSPNNDGMNDIFTVRSTCISNYHLLIYNRWGELVFESNDIKDGWNGYYRNKLMNTEVFAFYITGFDKKTNKEIEIKGNLTLIR